MLRVENYPTYISPRQVTEEQAKNPGKAVLTEGRPGAQEITATKNSFK